MMKFFTPPPSITQILLGSLFLICLFSCIDTETEFTPRSEGEFAQLEVFTNTTDEVLYRPNDILESGSSNCGCDVKIQSVTPVGSSFRLTAFQTNNQTPPDNDIAVLCNGTTKIFDYTGNAPATVPLTIDAYSGYQFNFRVKKTSVYAGQLVVGVQIDCSSGNATYGGSSYYPGASSTMGIAGTSGTAYGAAAPSTLTAYNCNTPACFGGI